jgi:transglutaminase-like putative cysteine protease
VRLHIEHTTRYVYARPVTFGRHRLVLRPREGHDLRVERMRLHITPAHELEWIRDVFGNSIALVDWVEPAETLTIVNDVVVERIAPFPTRAFHEPWRVAYPPQYDPMEAGITGVYSVPAYLEDATAVQAWLADGLTTDPGDAEGTVLALCDLVHRTIAYQRRLEKGVRSPGDTLRLKTGSCRDLATLMMDAARHLGIAARFASGYLHGTASLAGHASTHAWTEVYLPTLGWRGFDPTIGARTSFHHVVTGVSTHPRGVMPVSGAFTGSRSDPQSLCVSVKTSVLEPVNAAPVPVPG